jgi:hypothetical protein
MTEPRTDTVIDLRDHVRTRVRIEREDNPFAGLSPQERMRLIVRVLCELVAYGEVNDSGPRPGSPALGG